MAATTRTAEPTMRAEHNVRSPPVPPPHSIEAEQALLGSLLIDAAAWAAIAGLSRSGDLYRQDHRAIFQAIGALAGAGKPHDVVMVTEQLERTKQLEAIGGLAHLTHRLAPAEADRGRPRGPAT